MKDADIFINIMGVRETSTSKCIADIAPEFTQKSVRPIKKFVNTTFSEKNKNPDP